MGQLRKNSALSYLVESIIPFTDANLALSFRPSAFFRELSERSGHTPSTIAAEYYRARKKGIIRYIDGHFAIDEHYLSMHQRATVQPLPNQQAMLVMYDIPEAFAHKRRELRSLLRQLEFSQTQKSVWVSNHDHLEPVLALISRLKLSPYVQVFVGSTVFDHYMLLD